MRQFDLSALSASAGVLTLYKALQSTISGITNFAKSTVQAYSSFESMQMGLETFFQSAEKGKSVFEDLRKLSNQTTFGVDELANSATQLLNVGVSASSLNDTLVMIGNTAQGNKQKFAELTSVYAKIQSTGKAGAIQLQQLAMKGLPIYDVLKKIGVQGTATGEDITKAFQEMTKEGGQFYNAMENINKTIEGKEGFISDYFKEFKVNFAEITGIADMYKNVLDILKGAIGAVSDKLLEWNENPIAKAIFNGVLVATITSIIGLIGVSLIGAITALNAKLAITATLSAIVNPTSAVIALAIAGFAGVTVAVNKYKNALDEAEKSKNKALYIPIPTSVEQADERIKSLNQAKIRNERELEDNNKKIENAKKQIELYNKTIADAKKRGLSMAEMETISVGYDFETQEQILKDTEKSNKILKRRIDLIENELLPAEQKKRTILENEKSDLDKLTKIGEKYKAIFGTTTYGKTINEIDELTEQIKELEEMKNEKLSNGNSVLSSEEIKNAERMIKDFTDKKRELNIDLKILGFEDWQKDLVSIFDLDKNDIANGSADATLNAFSTYKEKRDKSNALMSKYGEYTGYNDFATQRKDLQDNIDKLNEVLATGHWEGTEESLKEFCNQIDASKDKLYSFSEKLNEWTSKQYASGNWGNALGGTVVQGLVAKSGDAQNFLGGFASGGVMGGVVSAVGGALSTVVGEVEGMEDVLNPLTTIIRTLTPIFELIVGVLKPFFAILDGIRSVLSAIVEGVLRPFEPLIRLISGLFERLANVFTKLFDSLDPIIQIIEMVVDTVLNGIDALLEPILQGFQVVGNFLQIFTNLAKPFLSIVNAISKAIKLLALPLQLLAKLFGWVAEGIEKLFKPFIDKLEAFGDWVDRLLGYEKEEEENKNDLTNAYKNLIQAIKDMEEYYDERKAKVRGQQAIDDATRVNDMIITPQGNFSTAPDDYIIATKNPNSLGGSGGVVMNVQINNTQSDKVTATTTQTIDENGFVNLLVNISQKVANDFAKGSNGWDSALAYRQVQASGRSVSI